MRVFVPVYVMANGVVPIDSGSTSLERIQNCLVACGQEYARNVIGVLAVRLMAPPMQNWRFSEGIVEVIVFDAWHADTLYGEPERLIFGILELEVSED